MPPDPTVKTAAEDMSATLEDVLVSLAAGGAAAAGVTAGGLLRAPRQVIVQPVNAKYANQFGFSFQAASTIKLTIVPVPPPGGAIRPAATEGDVLAKADQYLIKGADG